MLKEKTFWYGAVVGAVVVYFFWHPRTKAAMRGRQAEQG